MDGSINVWGSEWVVSSDEFLQFETGFRSCQHGHVVLALLQTVPTLPPTSAWEVENSQAGSNMNGKFHYLYAIQQHIIMTPISMVLST